jgi:hypothetical protein
MKYPPEIWTVKEIMLFRRRLMQGVLRLLMVQYCQKLGIFGVFGAFSDAGLDENQSLID